MCKTILSSNVIAAIIVAGVGTYITYSYQQRQLDHEFLVRFTQGMDNSFSTLWAFYNQDIIGTQWEIAGREKESEDALEHARKMWNRYYDHPTITVLLGEARLRLNSAESVRALKSIEDVCDAMIESADEAVAAWQEIRAQFHESGYESRQNWSKNMGDETRKLLEDGDRLFAEFQEAYAAFDNGPFEKVVLAATRELQ